MLCFTVLVLGWIFTGSFYSNYMISLYEDELEEVLQKFPVLAVIPPRGSTEQ